MRSVGDEGPPAAVLGDAAVEHEVDGRHGRFRPGVQRLAAAEGVHPCVLGDHRELVGMDVGEHRHRLDGQHALDGTGGLVSRRHGHPPSPPAASPPAGVAS